MIELHVKPGPAIAREQFLASHPPFSIALDGYVHGEPFLEVSARGPWRNFNHHEVVDRSCTSATCEQARRAVLLGLYDLFRVAGARRALLWVNDCDQDVCLATWILMNADRAHEPLVRVITQIEDLLDMSAGTFPIPHERDLLGEVRWVFDPYVRARPRVTTMSGDEMRQVIADVHLRIDQFPHDTRARTHASSPEQGWSETASPTKSRVLRRGPSLAGEASHRRSVDGHVSAPRSRRGARAPRRRARTGRREGSCARPEHGLVWHWRRHRLATGVSPQRGAVILDPMKKHSRKKDQKGHVTFEDLKRAARGTPKDAQELLDAIKEHRTQQRELLRSGRRARSTSK